MRNNDLKQNFIRDESFAVDNLGLQQAFDALSNTNNAVSEDTIPKELPENGLGEISTLKQLAPIVLGNARLLGAPEAFAHMDPPTPWITWATTFWNASLNQNLLHPDLSPVAKNLEERVINWLSPLYGMDGGHMVPGSSVANLTALWVARERRGIKKVIASTASHLSVKKAAHLLALEYLPIDIDPYGRLDSKKLPDDMTDAALVLTAGTTSAGAIDNLDLARRATWTHVDAAWAGPLKISKKFSSRLEGVENSDSISISAHKWFFQPKESGIIFFQNSKTSHDAISFGDSYLTSPNIGVLGSHGANAIPLLATFLAWGRNGMAERIERAMELADILWQRLASHRNAELYGPQSSGVTLWRPLNRTDIGLALDQLPTGSTSITTVNHKLWLRNVAANPTVDIERLWSHISEVLQSP